MANTFLKPEQIARASVGLLARDVVLPRLVWKDPAAEFRGKVGDTVNVRVPVSLTARAFTGAEWNSLNRTVVLDDVTETSVPVSLTHNVYSAVGVTDEDLTLTIENFGSQILEPQTRAVGEYIENMLATAMEDADYANAHTITATLGTDSPLDVSVEARKVLNLANVPMGDRYIVVGANVAEAFLNDPDLRRVDASGSDDALRDATIGRVAGFGSVVESNAIDPNLMIAFHRSAFVLATRAPIVPDGAVFGRGESYAGLAMRWLRDYDSAKLGDRSIVSAFAGATSIADRADEADPETGGGTNATKEVVRAVKITWA